MRKLLFIPILLILFCCKKDKTDPIPPIHTNLIAPCYLNDMLFDFDSVFYGTSTAFPTAPFSVKFIDTTNSSTYPEFIEFGFNKVPTTGMYYLVLPTSLGIPELENQISIKGGGGSIPFYSYGTYDNYGDYTDVIYVENNQNELIISYCEMPDSLYYFDYDSFSYVGNGPGYRKYRIAY